MRVLSSHRFLAVYSGVLTLCFVATVASALILCEVQLSRHHRRNESTC